MCVVCVWCVWCACGVCGVCGVVYVRVCLCVCVTCQLADRSARKPDPRIAVLPSAGALRANWSVAYREGAIIGADGAAWEGARISQAEPGARPGETAPKKLPAGIERKFYLVQMPFSEIVKAMVLFQ